MCIRDRYKVYYCRLFKPVIDLNSNFKIDRTWTSIAYILKNTHQLKIVCSIFKYRLKYIYSIPLWSTLCVFILESLFAWTCYSFTCRTSRTVVYRFTLYNVWQVLKTLPFSRVRIKVISVLTEPEDRQFGNGVLVRLIKLLAVHGYKLNRQTSINNRYVFVCSRGYSGCSALRVNQWNPFFIENYVVKGCSLAN